MFLIKCIKNSVLVDSFFQENPSKSLFGINLGIDIIIVLINYYVTFILYHHLYTVSGNISNTIKNSIRFVNSNYIVAMTTIFLARLFFIILLSIPALLYTSFGLYKINNSGICFDMIMKIIDIFIYPIILIIPVNSLFLKCNIVNTIKLLKGKWLISIVALSVPLFLGENIPNNGKSIIGLVISNIIYTSMSVFIFVYVNNLYKDMLKRLTR